MPNGNIHRTAGGWGAVFTYLMIQNKSEVKDDIDIGELIFSSFIGSASSRIPDILEPPLHPNHRAFFHSLVFGGIACYVGSQAWKDLQIKRSERKALGIQRWDINELIDVAVIVGSGSVILHIIMDGFTPKGLSII